tara:strand:+ start:111 stop:563 length:453 start_codon:yes stop_codon:yes gene_type:complete
MVCFLRIDKDKVIKETNIKDISDLYKCCGLRKAEGFEIIKEYNSNNMNIYLWGRLTGRTNIKNNYSFPDVTSVVYGTCAVVGYTKENILCDISIEDWNQLCIKDTISENNDNDSNNSDSSDSEEDNQSELSDYDSELKPDEYLYSSEEEN